MNLESDPDSESASDPVVLVADQQSYVAVDTDRWAALAADVLVSEGVRGPGEMSLMFVDTAAIAQLKGRYLDGGAEPTDVLSFPIDGGDGPAGPLRLIGDVVICPEVAAANAGANVGTRVGHDGSLEHEMALLVVHGVLHLLGMDHAEPNEAAAMKSREQRHLSLFWELSL
ncbi:MAG: rRNA maturation RNase YbeY [Acidimicrobiales bacterium]